MSVLGAVGAAAGFFIGGPAGAAMGYSIGSGVDAIVNAPDRIGPRLEDLRVQLSQYGAMVPFEWGTNRHAGTIIWPRILEAVEHREEESAKGGPDNVTFKYTLSCAVLLCEGPIAGVRRIWANKKIVYDVSESNTGPTQDPRVGSVRFHLGTEDQMMDPLIEATDGEGPAYRGYAYVVFEDYDVTDLNGRPPQWEFEVITDGNTEIAETTTFGEEFVSGTGGNLFDADMDENGHLWLHTMAGHARVNPSTGAPEVSPDAPATPQIHEYDAATGELLWYCDVQPESEPGGAVYPIGGTGLYSGGYYFIGRGYPGVTSQGGAALPYCHGLAVNTQTHAVEGIFSQCSQQVFQNAFYWSTVPIPVIDNNKVYFASGNGTTTGVSIGFMPASFRATGELYDYDPIPDFTGPEAKWNVHAGWTESRAKGAQCPTGPNKQLDCAFIVMPDWAFKSTLIKNPNAVIVQGRGDNGTYIALAANSFQVDGFDTTRADIVRKGALVGNEVVIPPIAWDSTNHVIWAFAGEAGAQNMLYQITETPDGLTATDTLFTMPNLSGDSQGSDVKGMAFDEETGYLRLIVGGGHNTDVRLVLFDPMTKTVMEERITGARIASTAPGKMWDLPGQNKAIFANGFKLYSIPYGASLAPGGVTLAKIVRDICVRAGLSDDDIDVSELTDPVDGYVVPRQMTARAAIEPLQQAFFFDAVESDDKIKFVKRGAPTATLIPLEDRAAHEYGQEMPDALTVTRAFEYELPVQCDVEYPDIEADHLIGNQVDKRITKDTRHNMNVPLPIVMTAEKAKSVARTLLYEAWQNQSFKFSTSRKYAHLEPASLVELPTESAMYRGRITAKREQPNGIINWDARVDSVSVYTQTGEGAAPTNYVPQEIFKPSTTYLEMLDIPLLRDEDENAGFYVAMGGV